jgi:ADP-ribose pyrophosphatase
MADDRVELIEREERHRGFFGLDRLTLRHRRFDGGWTEPMEREVLLQKRAVGLLPYDPVTDRVVLIEQFRSGAWAAGEPAWMVEVVAGIVGPGEAHEDVARREAMEEAGLVVGALEPIASYAPSPGASTEWVTLFAGRVSAPAQEGVFGLAAEHEDIRAFSLPADEAIARLDAGGIANAVTLIALSWFARHHAMLRRKWT